MIKGSKEDQGQRIVLHVESMNLDDGWGLVNDKELLVATIVPGGLSLTTHSRQMRFERK